MNYCHVENGVIDEGPTPIPKAWRNISGLHHLDVAKLKALGWLPVRYENETYDPATQVRTGPAYVIEADEVVATYTAHDKTPQELDAEKDEIADRIAQDPIVQAINNGSIVPGSNMTGAALTARIKAGL